MIHMSTVALGLGARRFRQQRMRQTIDTFSRVEEPKADARPQDRIQRLPLAADLDLTNLNWKALYPSHAVDPALFEAGRYTIGASISKSVFNRVSVSLSPMYSTPSGGISARTLRRMFS